jgi:hypothetical protein
MRKKGVVGVKAKHKKFERLCVETQVKEWWRVNWYKLSLKEKKSFGLPILLKTIKDQHEVSGSINMLPSIKINGKPFSYDVGS